MVFDSDNNYPDCKFPHSVEANVGLGEIVIPNTAEAEACLEWEMAHDHSVAGIWESLVQG